MQMPSATNTTRLRVWRSPCCAAFALLLIQAAVVAARKAAYDLPLYLLEVAVRFGEVRHGYRGPRGQGNARPNGRMLVAEVQSARFLVTGANANLAFAEQLGARGTAQLLAVQEGIPTTGAGCASACATAVRPISDCVCPNPAEARW